MRASNAWAVRQRDPAAGPRPGLPGLGSRETGVSAPAIAIAPGLALQVEHLNGMGEFQPPLRHPAGAIGEHTRQSPCYLSTVGTLPQRQAAHQDLLTLKHDE